MKTRLTLSVLACLIFCGQAWAGEYVWNIQQCDSRPQPMITVHPGGRETTHYSTGCTIVGMDNAIRQWAKEGEICRVLDHQWIYGPKGETHTFSENPPAMWLVHPRLEKDQRYCPVCKTLMMKIKTERWEVVKP